MSLPLILVVPHSPALINTLTPPDTREKFKPTLAAFEELATSLIEEKIETLLFVSSHAEELSDAFMMQVRPGLIGHLKEFGDFSSEVEPRVNLIFANQLQKQLRRTLPLAIDSHEELDHGVTVPLMLLTKPGQRPPIIPLSHSGLSAANHWTFGKTLGKILQNSYHRVALVISGDLSHALHDDSPAGYHEDGEKYDQTVLETVDTGNFQKLLEMSPELIVNAAECSHRGLVILGGVLNGQQIKSEILSYDAPSRVGLLVARLTNR